MKKYLPAIFLFASLTLTAQSKLSADQLHMIAGYGKHGTGDLNGFGLAVDYEHPFTGHLSWAIDLGGTVHDGHFPVLYKDPLGHSIDGSIRYTTAGLQAAGYLGYSPLRTFRHDLQVRGGGLVRYQSSSLADIYAVFSPQATGLTFPVITVNNRSPQRTLTIGYGVQLLYTCFVSRRTSFGVMGSWQNDTNGDLISQVSIVAGRRL